jgi:hypothetical protein
MKTHWNKGVIQKVIHSTVPSQIAFLALLLCSLTFESPASNQLNEALDRVLSGTAFDLAGWIIGAAGSKVGHELAPAHNALADSAQSALISTYLQDLRRVGQIEADIAARFADPAVSDAQRATETERAERDRLRTSLASRQTTAEAILQEQVESVLREEGFASGGQTLPPLRFQLTQLPYLLIVSPRDRIARIDQRELRTGLRVDDIDRIEHDTEQRFNVSAFVTPIGGYGTYPTMLPETPSLNFIVRTAAHEWAHVYLFPSYVGLAYNRDGVARTINETAAVIVEREIGERVLQRFYPQLLSSAALVSDARPGKPLAAFDFNAEMRITRLRADELLAAGDIEGAERYMEERRAIFVRNGYIIRRLNQAYFAFYGAYNAEPGGAPAAGSDPIGPAVQALRARSPSLKAFVEAIARVRSLEDLTAVP